MTNLPNILHFAPRLYSMIWGGSAMAAFKGIDTTQEAIGESWEISAVPGKESVADTPAVAGRTLAELASDCGEALLGRRSIARYGAAFPLLVKFIDADADLSIQVHPTDELAAERHGSLGKTEMWYVIDTRPGAVIKAGLARELDAESYRGLVTAGTFADAVAAYPSHPGDTYFIPAGRVHAICAGNLLAEIQESSDVTYRIFDYNRLGKDGLPRELHTDLAADAIDYTVLPDYRNTPVPTAEPDTERVVACDHFTVDRIALQAGAGHVIAPAGESFVVVMALEGEADITCGADSYRLRRGDTVLLPASAPAATLRGRATLLTARV